jgi:squalene synthase HpnC
MKQSTIDSSFKYCENLTKSHYENFPVASLLLPAEKRKYMYAIYSFARTADDFADEDGIGDKNKRLELLENWSLEIDKGLNNDTDNPIFIALSKTILDLDISVQYFRDLIKAFKQDVRKNRYEKFEELTEYCKWSANPVGRIVLLVFGIRDNSSFEYSDKICTALQLTNFWQDILIDLQKDRIYLPEEDMNRFGYCYEKIKNKTLDDSFKELLKHEIRITRDYFKNGSKLIKHLKKVSDQKRLILELKMTILGGLEILNKIERNDYDIFSRRPILQKLDFLKFLFNGSL